MAHNIIVGFHPLEDCYPDISNDNRVECSICKYSILYNGRQYVATEYSFSYETNSAIACCWCIFPTSKLLGYHPGDVEKLTILDDEFGNHSYVFFKAHSTGQGMWLPYYDCQIGDRQELIVYIARGSHAFYPFNGIYWRIFGIANDLCSDDGRHLQIVVTKEHSDHYNPPTSSILPWERVLIPLTLKRIKDKAARHRS